MRAALVIASLLCLFAIASPVEGHVWWGDGDTPKCTGGVHVHVSGTSQKHPCVSLGNASILP